MGIVPLVTLSGSLELLLLEVDMTKVLVVGCQFEIVIGETLIYGYGFLEALL